MGSHLDPAVPATCGKADPRIKALNAKIRSWAQGQKVVCADFRTAMALPDATINTAFAEDTVHPNAAGYAVMEPIVRAAIAEVLKP